MISIFYASILALIYFALSVYVIKARFKYKISIGDGRNDDLSKRMRIHGNFIEYVPFVLILLALSEFNGASSIFIHGVGAALLVGRLSHIIGLGLNISIARIFGMLLTFASLLVPAVYGLLNYLS